MKLMPITKCPKCNKPLLNYQSFDKKILLWEKICNSANHYFGISLSETDDSIYQVIVKITQQLYCMFDYNNLSITVYDLNSKIYRINIPWFEPDFNNYNLLIKNIKTYVLLS